MDVPRKGVAATATDYFAAQDAPVRLVHTDASGFGLVATRAIAPGERILVERPLACTVCATARPSVCAVCLRELDEDRGQPCGGGCSALFYCSAPCAAVGDRVHSAAECAALGRVDQSDVPAELMDLVVQAVRILCDRQLQRSVEPFAGSPWTVSYSSYVDRLQGIRRTRANGEQLRLVTIHTLRAVAPDVRVPPQELFDVLNRHQCNAYGVSGPGGEDRALASFVGALHLLNHSCVPNVVFDSAPQRTAASGGDVAHPPLFAVVALAAIDEGEELVHCYARSSDGPSARRSYVRVHYGFDCACMRCACADPATEAQLARQLDGWRCPSPHCGTGLGYPLAEGGRRCVHCATSWEPEAVSDAEEAAEARLHGLGHSWVAKDHPRRKRNGGPGC